MRLRDWTLQYSLLPAGTEAGVPGSCNCPAGYTTIGEECVKISTLPTEQPPTHTPLLMIVKTYAQYSKHGTLIYNPGYALNGSGTSTLYNLLPFWRNIALNTVDGPMNRCALWTAVATSYQQIGFSVCVNIPTDKTYLIGWGADNFAFLRIDGKYIIRMAEQEVSATFDYWHVYPVEIKAGIHVIEVIANNMSSIAAFGGEIYDCTPAELLAIDNVPALDAVTIFSTKNMRGQYTNLGTNGYPLLQDYALTFCLGNPPFYRRMEYLDCCPQNPSLVECNCTFSFSSYVNNSTSVLDVGNLLGGTCVLEQYVIDWYLDGVHTLVSGTTLSDSDVEAFHPFTGLAAIPLPGGSWVPVIRWVMIAGDRIYNHNNNCNNWCTGLTGLPTITVSSLHCGITGGSPATGYQYKITYNTSQDYALAAKSFRWDLPPDLSVINMAMQFTGYTVADKVEVFFKDSLIPFVSWIIGSQYNNFYYAAMPWKRATSSYFKFAFAIPTYEAGDYLTIKVTPSVLESNILTNWELNIKCLTAATIFNCGFLTHEMHTYDLPATRLDYDSVNCRYVLVLKALQPMHNWQGPSDPDYPMSLYAGIQQHLSSNTYYNRSTNEMGVYLSFNKTATLNWWRSSDYATFTPRAGIVNLTKVGWVWTFTCASQIDYDWFKLKYETTLAGIFGTGYIADPTDVRHYRYWNIFWQSMPLGCGDTSIQAKNVYINYESPFVWDDVARTIEITSVPLVNGIISEPCNNSFTTMANMVSSINASNSAANFSQDTLCSVPLFGFGVGYSGTTVNKVTTLNGQAGYFAYGPNTQPCESSLSQFYMHPTIPANFEWFTHFCRCVITATVDGSGNFTESPSDNFRVDDMLDPVTRALMQPFAYTRIYEKADGVQIFP